MPPETPSATVPFEGPRAGPPLQAGAPLEMVIVSGAALTRQSIAAGERKVVGRSADCDVLVTDRNVSRHHVAVWREGDRCFVEDLGSSNGTRLGGVRLALGERRRLGPMEAVGLGSSLLVVRPPPTPDGAADLVPCVLDDDEYRRVRTLAASPGPIAIVGPAGVGKHTLARALHGLSGRTAVALREVTLDAVSPLEAEALIFGDSGAREPEGVLDRVDGGTLVVSGLDALPERTQLQLLDACERGEFTRRGSTSLHRVDVRIVFLSVDPLDALRRLGAVARRVVHRLASRTVVLRPLDERRDALVEITARLAKQLGAGPGTMGEAEIAALAARRWPGNLPELAAAVRAAIDGPEAARTPSAQVVGESSSETQPSRRRAILEALERCRGNQTAAAKLLGVSRRTLVYWLDRYEVPRPRKRG